MHKYKYWSEKEHFHRTLWSPGKNYSTKQDSIICLGIDWPITIPWFFSLSAILLLLGFGWHFEYWPSFNCWIIILMCENVGVQSSWLTQRPQESKILWLQNKPKSSPLHHCAWPLVWCVCADMLGQKWCCALWPTAPHFPHHTAMLFLEKRQPSSWQPCQTNHTSSAFL